MGANRHRRRLLSAAHVRHFGRPHGRSTKPSAARPSGRRGPALARGRKAGPAVRSITNGSPKRLSAPGCSAIRMFTCTWSPRAGCRPVSGRQRSVRSATPGVLPITPTFYVYATVGQGYRRFRRTSDDEALAMLDRARDRFVESAVRPGDGGRTPDHPQHPTGIVVFAHGCGSSRHRPRNRYVADVLNRAGRATEDQPTPGAR